MKVGLFTKSKLAVPTVPTLKQRLRPNINVPPELAAGLAVLGQVKAVAALNPLSVANAQLAALKTQAMNQVMSRATASINAKKPPSIYPADMASSLASALSEAQELLTEAEALASDPTSLLQEGVDAATTLVPIL